jgi:hypothetical protein
MNQSSSYNIRICCEDIITVIESRILLLLSKVVVVMVVKVVAVAIVVVVVAKFQVGEAASVEVMTGGWQDD